MIDPAKVGKFPIRISDELLRDEGPRKRQRFNVQYNHRPKFIDGQSAVVKHSKENGTEPYTLRLKNEDGDGIYKYKGRQEPSTSVALIYIPEKQSFRLERIDAELLFNVQCTPSEKDASILRSRYPQLRAKDQANQEGPQNTGLSGEEEDMADARLPADESNPYDYRHFLGRDASPSPQPSAQASPIPNHMFNSSPLAKPASPASRPRFNTHPRKRSPQRKPQRYLSPNPQEEDNADNEESDANELIIDNGEPAVDTTKPWRRDLGNALNVRGRSNGPISFRSAASSMSPSVRARSDDEKDQRDNDVEEIDLGSPRVGGTHSDNEEEPEAPVNGNGWDDDEDGILEAELEQAMEQEAENGLGIQLNHQYPPAAPAESSSESEEE